MCHDATIRICAVGDVMLGDSSHFIGRGVRSHLLRMGGEFFFGPVRSHLEDCDVLIGNLESPISRSPGPRSWDRVYVAPVEAVETLSIARHNVFTLANNHILEHGPLMLQETRGLLGEAGISCPGFSADGAWNAATSCWQQNGLTIALAAASLVPEFSGRPVDVEAAVQWLESWAQGETADIRMVSLHWGDEYVDRPSPEQRRIAQRLVGAGVHLLVGHHPHVLQPVETMGSALVAYSLGNFVFDQDWSRETRSGGVLRVELGRGGVLDWSFLPTVRDHACRPVPAVGEEARRLAELISAEPVVEETEYVARLRRGKKRHRILMKWELLRNFFRVTPQTLHFLLTKRKRPRPGFSLSRKA